MPFDHELIEAKLALDLIASADMPSIAWEAWESGLDGVATRRLGVLERPTYFEIAELLPRVRQELGLSYVSRNEAAKRIARRIARDILKSGDDPLLHLRDFRSLWIRADYDHAISGLGTLYEDVWIARSGGQSDGEIRASVTSFLKTFVESEGKA